MLIDPRDPYNGAMAWPRMDHDDWEVQPPEAWREIERIVWAHWPARARHVTNTQAGSGVPEAGWLTVARGKHLEAFDVPVGRMFSALAVARRGGG